MTRLPEAIECLCWSSDGSRLLAGDLDGHLLIAEVIGAGTGGTDGTDGTDSGNGSRPELRLRPVPAPTERSATALSPEHPNGILSAAWHPGRPLAATGGADGTVLLHDLADGGRTRVEAGGRVHALGWSPGGDLLAVAADSSVLMLDAGGEHVVMVPFLPGTVHALAWVAGPTPLAAGTRDGVAWLSPAAREPNSIEPVRGAAIRLMPDPSRRRLAAADLAGGLHLHDYSSDEEVHVTGWDHISGLAWDDRGTRLAVAEDGEVTVWRLDGVHLEDDEPVRLPGHDGPIRDLVYQGNVLATGAEDGTVVRWSPRRLHDPPVERFRAPVRAVAWHPHRPHLAVGTADGGVHLVIPGHEPGRGPGHDPDVGSGLSPSG